MSQAATFEKVKKIIVEQLSIEDADTVTPEASFVNDLGADSIDVVELIMELEIVFNIELETDESNAADTVQKIIDLILLKMQQK